MDACHVPLDNEHFHLLCNWARDPGHSPLLNSLQLHLQWYNRNSSSSFPHWRWQLSRTRPAHTRTMPVDKGKIAASTFIAGLVWVSTVNTCDHCGTQRVSAAYSFIQTKCVLLHTSHKHKEPVGLVHGARTNLQGRWLDSQPPRLLWSVLGQDTELQVGPGVCSSLSRFV